MKYITVLLVVLFILCGCQSVYLQTNDIMQQMPSASSSNAVEQTNNIFDITEIEATQPPCLACDTTDIYTSNAPAKQSWNKAYQTFYSSVIRPEQEYLDIISNASIYENVINNLELRSDKGLDFVYLHHGKEACFLQGIRG